jgi:hypothetical protein
VKNITVEWKEIKFKTGSYTPIWPNDV